MALVSQHHNLMPLPVLLAASSTTTTATALRHLNTSVQAQGLDAPLQDLQDRPQLALLTLATARGSQLAARAAGSKSAAGTWHRLCDVTLCHIACLMPCNRMCSYAVMGCMYRVGIHPVPTCSLRIGTMLQIQNRYRYLLVHAKLCTCSPQPHFSG